MVRFIVSRGYSIATLTSVSITRTVMTVCGDNVIECVGDCIESLVITPVSTSRTLISVTELLLAKSDNVVMLSAPKTRRRRPQKVGGACEPCELRSATSMSCLASFLRNERFTVERELSNVTNKTSVLVKSRTPLKRSARFRRGIEVNHGGR